MNTLSSPRLINLLIGLALFTFSNLSFANNDLCSITCYGQVNHTLGPNGVSTITPSMLGPSSNCTGPLEVHITDANGVDIGNQVNCTHAGQTLMASVIDVASGVNCWGLILIEDKTKPTITCSDIMIPCNADTSPANTGFPVFSDNCGIQGNPTFTDEEVDLDCADLLFVAMIKRTWTVVDVNGNAQSCEQNIFLEKANIFQTTFPSDTILDCSTTNLDPSLLGEPMINGIVIGGYCDLKFTHTDGPTFDMCGGSYKFLRTWTVIDCCTNDIFTDDQLIELRDTTPPMITCPVDITLSTQSNDCTGSLFLPNPSVSDDCSNFTITNNFNFTQVGNVYVDIPLGTHAVTYYATDDCGNVDSCTFNITVKDQIDPVAFCYSLTTVSITTDGMAKVYPGAFDIASSDNCGIDTMMIRKMSDPDFSECLTFDCSEVGDTLMVVLRVVDECGNFNECMVETIIDDKLSPSITCPPDTILQCTSYENFIATTPSISDNCGLDTMFFADDSTGFNLCSKTGIILREWFVQDLGGLLDSCTQTITVVDTTTLVFNYPLDTTINCTDPTDPSFTGSATIMGGCGSYAVAQIDVPLEQDECNRKILRTWKFYDNCADTFLLDSMVQKIIITDMEAPMIMCDSLFLYDFNNSCDEAGIPFAIAIDSCSAIDTIMNDYTGAVFSNKGDSISALFPIGDTQIKFTAIDSCGNEASCISLVTVNDITGPKTIECEEVAQSFAVPALPNSISVNEALYIGNSAAFPNLINALDKCSEPPTQQWTITGIDYPSVSCNDIPSGSFLKDEFVVTFFDLYGNDQVCNSSFLYFCPSGLSLAGIVQNEDQDYIENVMIKISDGTNTMMNYPSQGIYLQDNLTTGNNYTVTPEKDVDLLNGVTTYDLALIQKHILGVEILDSPYKIIAADANNSGSVTALDITKLRGLILHMTDTLPNNTSWRFVDSKFQFSNPINPFADDFPEQMECVNLTEPMLNMNFIAIKVGDVNSTALVNDLATTDTRGDDSMIDFTADNILLEKGNTYSVPIFAKDLNELEGFQFTLGFDPTEIELIDIKNGYLKKENFGFRYEDQGAITCSWNRNGNEELNSQNPLFYLDFKSKTNNLLENILQLNSRFTTTEAYNIKNKIHGINFQFQKNGLDLYPDSEEIILFQNNPNPFSTSSEIKFFTPHNTTIELQILDISGKIVTTFHQEKAAGFHSISVESSIFPAPGIYFYKLTTPTFSATKKMLIID